MTSLLWEEGKREISAQPKSSALCFFVPVSMSWITGGGYKCWGEMRLSEELEIRVVAPGDVLFGSPLLDKRNPFINDPAEELQTRRSKSYRKSIISPPTIIGDYDISHTSRDRTAFPSNVTDPIDSVPHHAERCTHAQPGRPKPQRLPRP